MHDVRQSLSRPDSRRAATRQAILETAESLFGEHGIDAVSLRQIGSTIGAANPAVVSYHFGDKEALLKAILQYRLPIFEERRAALANEFKGDKPDIAHLLRAIWLPVFEQRNAEGKRSYAAFLTSLGRSQWGAVWTGSAHIAPVTLSLGRKIKALTPASARRFQSERLIATAALITTTIEMIDSRETLGAKAEQTLFEDAIRMAAAALSAPGA